MKATAQTFTGIEPHNISKERTPMSTHNATLISSSVSKATRE